MKLVDGRIGKDGRGVDKSHGLHVGDANNHLFDLVQWTVLTIMVITLSPKKIF